MSANSTPATWALILKKAPSAAKSRLAAVLSEPQRSILVEKLFQHVLATALDTEEIAHIAVISPEQLALPEPMLWLQDRADNMNDCVAQGLHELHALGASRVLVLPSDLPLLCSSDLTAMVTAPVDYAMVIAPDEFNAGTNALLLNLPSAFTPRFGVDSFTRHLAEADRRGLKTLVVRKAGLAFDLDDQRDWQKFCTDNQSAAEALTVDR